MSPTRVSLIVSPPLQASKASTPSAREGIDLIKEESCVNCIAIEKNHVCMHLHFISYYTHKSIQDELHIETWKIK